MKTHTHTHPNELKVKKKKRIIEKDSLGMYICLQAIVLLNRPSCTEDLQACILKQLKNSVGNT